MTTTEAPILNVIEKTSVRALLVKYFGASDDKCRDLAVVERTFTGDAQITQPNGSETIGSLNIFNRSG